MLILCDFVRERSQSISKIVLTFTVRRRSLSRLKLIMRDYYLYERALSERELGDEAK